MPISWVLDWLYPTAHPCQRGRTVAAGARAFPLPFLATIPQLLHMQLLILVVEMGGNTAYSSRNLLWSLLVSNINFYFRFLFQNLPSILVRLAIGQNPIIPNHILSCTQSPSFPVPGMSPGPVSLFRLFWYFGVFSLPILTELIFSCMSYKDRRVRTKEGGPLKGEIKRGAVKFAPKDCKNLAEKDVLLLYLMLWPVAWICTYGQPANLFKHSFVTGMCSWGFVEVIKGKMDSQDEFQLQVKTVEHLNIYD